MRNYVHIRRGYETQIYVECTECNRFVARYTLHRYTSDRPYESLLQHLTRHSTMSAKRMLRHVESFSQTVEDGFRRVKEIVRTHPERRRIEEIQMEIDETE